MPFDEVGTQQVDFPAMERAMLKFWDEVQAFDQLRQKNKDGPIWSFLDGPITANNPMGVHHAWGRTYKDAFQRYHAMLGQRQRYQNGFDCQGLWVEVEVEKELKLASKRDIENLVPGDRFASIDRFVRLCKERVDKFARVQTEQSIRLGYWMDWDRTEEDWARAPGERKSYFTMSEENNYTIWAFLKKCHTRGLIYRGFDAMPWCPRCGVGLSEMEVKEGYKRVTHRSVFVAFPLRDRPNENLLVWTTTPWTLSSNVGAAVNPEHAYLRVRHKDQVYYVGKTAFTAARSEEEVVDEVEVEVDHAREKKGAAPRLKSIEQLFKEKGKDAFEIVGEVRGADMVGWAYDGPFDELPAQSHACGYPPELAEVVRRQHWAPEVSAKQAHRVVAWKEVGATTGTGIVHIAPGCGKEDFHLAREPEVGLPPIAPLNDAGEFLAGFGWLEGLPAVEPATAERILDNLREKGRLFASEIYPHSYPHCWRCKTELLFRLVDEWFINMKWRGEIMDVTRQVRFLPPAIGGEARELKWLEQMGDWMISKKRFWGLALPIWVDEQTGDFEVIGSREELKARAVEGWDEFDGHTPHRPWVDKVKIRNPKTGNLMERIGDVGNPWLDAGIVPYSTMGYNSDRNEWEKWFPADFITESFPGQFRNWFYAILAMSTMMEGRPPFRVLLGHALVFDQNGDTMAKAKGNSIEFNGAADSGYELFLEREPKLSVEAQAKRDLPTGYISAYEGDATIDGKPLKVVRGKYKPIGADVIRWLYCRNNPAANINFGPDPADELRAAFHLKLWNCYAFFCNYARLDGFDPNAPAVPVAQRRDIDRWVLSDLQGLIAQARKAFDAFDVMAFCLAVERFVDDKLSNWYIRRNRRRFQVGEMNQDKRAAYQTLYTVLVTLTKLCAPVVPFLSEVMYQNLVVKGAGDGPVSVHLCDYPTCDASLEDEALSEDMTALLRLVSLGSSARNAVKIKVRQPLAELRVQPAGAADRRAVARFADQITEELNVKRVTLHEGGELLRVEVCPNRKTMGPKFGPRLNEALTALASANAAEVAAKVAKGEPFTLGDLTFDAADVLVTRKGPDGWAGVEDRGTQVALDARVTESLKAEGLARDVVRQVQDLRKSAGLRIEDRIELCLTTADATLHGAIEAHRDYIATETLTTRWGAGPLGAGAQHGSVKIEGKELSIELRRVE